jgi:arylsulfatase
MSSTSPKSRPNIIFLLPDQLRPDFLSTYGASFIDTPNIDGLAGEGVCYDRAYSASPICVPARTALLTGMNAVRNGVTDNLHRIRSDYEAAGIRTWPQLLADAGYYTAAIGKMHFYPWNASHGFQHRVTCEDKVWLHVQDDYFHYLRERGRRKLHGNEHEGYFENRGAITHAHPWEHSWDRFVGREACSFIRDSGNDGPFAMMVGFPGPHNPYDPAADFPEKYDAENMPNSIPEAVGDTPKVRQKQIDALKGGWNGVDYAEFSEGHKKKMRAHYAALVKGIDYEVGQIVEALRSEVLLDNTIIVFASDHGDYLGDHNLAGKGSFYETSMRIPMIVRVPGLEPATSHELVELRDVTATLLAFAGIERPSNMDAQTLPGLSVSTDEPRDRIFGLLADGWMVNDGTWKLTKYRTGESVLFNLIDDPLEQKNQIADLSHAATLRRLDTELTVYLMNEMRLSMFDRLADCGNMSQDPSFGREGWSREFPAPVRDAH